MASGLFYPTWRDMLDASQLAIDFDAETHKVALFTSSLGTVSYQTNTAWNAAPFNANEVGATGTYVSGGNVLTGTSVSESPAGTLMWDASDWSVTSTTISLAKYALIYADSVTTPTADPAICLVDFGSTYSTSSGTFQIQWATAGIITISLYTP